MGLMIILWIIFIVAASFTAFFAGVFYAKKHLETKIKQDVINDIQKAEKTYDEIIASAKTESSAIIRQAKLDGKEEAHKIIETAEKEAKRTRDEIKRAETRLEKKEASFDKREEQFLVKEEKLEEKQIEIRDKEERLDKLITEEEEKLYKIAQLTPEEAKDIIFNETKREYEHDLAQMFKEIKDEKEEEAERHSQWVVTTAIQRYAADYVNEGTVSTVSLPTDDMKGRIIGREGRNIRAFEKITGADLIIDDTPEIVVVSCFNPLRREVARLTLEKLVADGRIHPANIEETYDKAKKEIAKLVKEEGERATFETGVRGLNNELIKLIGRLKYRTSFGQNVLEHSIEVAKFAGMMAEELGLNVDRAKRGALLHDIGKGVDHEVEGSHALIGAELAKRYGEKDDIINMIQFHHGETEPESPEASLVAAADAISAARPGARRETVDLYIKRLQKLEEIAKNHKTVEKAYAIQAGRELRILVQPDKIDDVMADKLAFDIAKEVEEGVEYPGQLKVTVIREKRSVAYAK
jgi:ribonuclease Y